ncbi:MAG: CDP-diacylglycerol--glycerol-3-phosphate 3-phosphatidyltransferase [Ardenticatenales bacterium]|nr:CDP-diacylglycerol--glycerol-3-phosphate 3-phosphatidyltransferase [Ardenticatenales bacterium]
MSFVLFLLATITDAVDGYLARSRGIVTVFGRIADPFVDKVVVAGALVLLTVFTATRVLLAPWMVVVIVSREFLVTGIRGWMESEGINFQAEKPGKYKMVLQVIAISGLLIVLATGTEAAWFLWTVRVVIWATLLLTLYSGWFYVRKAMSATTGLSI